MEEVFYEGSGDGSPFPRLGRDHPDFLGARDLIGTTCLSLMTESWGFTVLHWFFHPAVTFPNGPLVDLLSVAHLQWLLAGPP